MLEPRYGHLDRDGPRRKNHRRLSDDQIDLIEDAELRGPDECATTTGPPTSASRSEPPRAFPLSRSLPTPIPRRPPPRSSAPRQDGPRRAVTSPSSACACCSTIAHLGTRSWRRRRRAELPDLVPFDRLQGGARARHAGDGEEYPTQQHRLVRSALFQLDTMEALVSSGPRGRLLEVSRLQLRAGRIGRDLAARRVRPPPTPSITIAPAALGFKLSPRLFKAPNRGSLTDEHVQGSRAHRAR